jgi:hypothetical protein
MFCALRVWDTEQIIGISFQIQLTALHSESNDVRQSSRTVAKVMQESARGNVFLATHTCPSFAPRAKDKTMDLLVTYC